MNKKTNVNINDLVTSKEATFSTIDRHNDLLFFAAKPCYMYFP